MKDKIIKFFEINYWDLTVYEYDPTEKTSLSNFDKIYFTINGKKFVATKIKE